jgi:hypothetical protein
MNPGMAGLAPPGMGPPIPPPGPGGAPPTGPPMGALGGPMGPPGAPGGRMPIPGAPMGPGPAPGIEPGMGAICCWTAGCCCCMACAGCMPGCCCCIAGCGPPFACGAPMGRRPPGMPAGNKRHVLQAAVISTVTGMIVRAGKVQAKETTSWHVAPPSSLLPAAPDLTPHWSEVGVCCQTRQARHCSCRRQRDCLLIPHAGGCFPATSPAAGGLMPGMPPCAPPLGGPGGPPGTGPRGKPPGGPAHATGRAGQSRMMLHLLDVGHEEKQQGKTVGEASSETC